jgi:hypothetical protein
VIDRISKGRNIAGLLYYLFGPGKSDEHVNQHLVAGWREPAGLEPQVRPNGQRDFRRLTGLLNAPLDMTGRRGQDGTVWHCVLSAAPGDQLMSDAKWNEIAAEFMDRMGLARRDDPTGVRWVAVRHGLSKGGIDHIHIAATLARQDGTLPSVHNDFLRARRACQAIERQSGLQVTAPADRTAAVRPTRAETERSARNSSTEPSRVRLRRRVQEAAAMARSEADFFARLRDSGALIRERHSDQDPGKVTGYAVALPGDVTRTGDPVWYGGGKLAPDLTLPRLRRRWERSRNMDHRAAPPEQDLSPRSVRAFLRSIASSAAERARDEATFFNGGAQVAGMYIDAGARGDGVGELVLRLVNSRAEPSEGRAKAGTDCGIGRTGWRGIPPVLMPYDELLSSKRAEGLDSGVGRGGKAGDYVGLSQSGSGRNGASEDGAAQRGSNAHVWSRVANPTRLADRGNHVRPGAATRWCYGTVAAPSDPGRCRRCNKLPLQEAKPSSSILVYEIADPLNTPEPAVALKQLQRLTNRLTRVPGLIAQCRDGRRPVAGLKVSILDRCAYQLRCLYVLTGVFHV